MSTVTISSHALVNLSTSLQSYLSLMQGNRVSRVATATPRLSESVTPCLLLRRLATRFLT